MHLKIKKLVNKFLGLFPSPLPQGVAEFDSWAKSIMDTYDLPTKDEDSIKFSLAAAIVHLGSQECFKAKYFFVLIIRSGAAKQIAGHVFSDIKNKQKEREAAAQAALAAEATKEKVASSEQSV